MTSEEFKETYKAKGWTQELLKDRWGISIRRVGQIVDSPEDNRHYWSDAINGIYKIDRSSDSLDIKKYLTFTQAQFREKYQEKGWTADSLALHWGFSNKPGMYRLIKRNPAVAIDALYGLPINPNKGSD